MGRLRAPILFPFLTCLSLAVNVNAQAPTLQPGVPIDRTLRSGETHEFTVKLAQNDYIQLVVEQQGIDVVVKVGSPTGKSLGEFDSPNGNDGPEHVSFVATGPGLYNISVRPLNSENTSVGRFQIKILELRPATEQELKASQNLEVGRAKGIALLGELEGAIPQIRSPFTRIKAQLQASQLLWDFDEKRASRYLTDATTGMKEFLSSVDVESHEYSQQYSGIAQLRYEIVQVWAGRDPEAALAFFYSTAPKSNPYGDRRELYRQESALELSIADQIAAKDPNRALQVARRSLKHGYSYNLIGTLSRLRRKNPEIAAEFERELAAKLLNETLLKSREAAQIALSLLTFGRAPASPHMPQNGTGSMLTLLPEDQYRELLQKIVSEALSYTPSPDRSYLERDAAWNMLTGLRSMSAVLDADVMASVEKKVAELDGNSNRQLAAVQQFHNTLANNPAVDRVIEVIEKAPEEQREQLYIQLANREANNGNLALAKQIINDHVFNVHQRRQALLNLDQQEIYRAASKGKIEEALRNVAALRDPKERANQLAGIANQIGPGQKRAVAISLLEQARGMLGEGVQARDQSQMNALFEIARVFSRYDSKRSFEIIDPLIEQFNEICAAARILEGFGFENFQDDELNLQSGGSVSGTAINISTVLGTLALANFERAKAASEKLRLPEVRVKAQLEIAQQTIQAAK
jgi:hypothetical protein